MNSWKHAALLVGGLGFSHLGNWIYFVAINIALLELTDGSAAAMAGLFVIRPIALLLTNFWSGSIVDRTDVHKLMVLTDVVRGTLMLFIPFASSAWVIFGLIFLISLAGSFFGPSQSVYITKLIPAEDRQRFNSILGMSSSGAFLLGPAISGLLIYRFGTDFSIYFNAVTFFVCALMISLLPAVPRLEGPAREPVTLRMLRADWGVVRSFVLTAPSFLAIYLLFQSSVIIGYSIDSQELTYIKQQLKLSTEQYGFIVSVTGIGALAGSFTAALLAKRVSWRWYLGPATLLTSVFYFLFYLSHTFFLAAAAFVLLGFFMSYVGAGYATWFQKQVPSDRMGRVASLADAAQGALQIGLTLAVGGLADVLGLQAVCLAFSAAAIALSLGLSVKVWGRNQSKSNLGC